MRRLAEVPALLPDSKGLRVEACMQEMWTEHFWTCLPSRLIVPAIPPTPLGPSPSSSVSPSRLSSPRRRRSPRCPSVVACLVPTDVEAAGQAAQDAVREGVSRGFPAMRIRLSMPPFDPIGGAYDPRAFAALALQVSTALVSIGSVLLLVPGPQTAQAAELQLADYPFASRQRIAVATFSLHELPDPKHGSLPAAVVVAGLSPSTGADDASVLMARRWLQLGCDGTCTVTCLNARFSARGAPIELRRFRTVYALLHHTVVCPDCARSSRSRAASGAMRSQPRSQPRSQSRSQSRSQPADTESDEAAGGLMESDEEAEAVVLRVVDGPWRVLLDIAGLDATTNLDSTAIDAQFEEVASLDERPDEGALDALVLKAVGARRAARQAVAAAVAGAMAAAPALAAEMPSVAVGAAKGTVALTWAHIERDTPVGGGVGSSAMQLYRSACLLRLAVLPAGGAHFEEEKQGVLHLILPGDALVRQTGAALGACLLRIEDGGIGVCRLEQLVVEASTGASGGAYAARLLARAEHEAVCRQQRWLVSCLDSFPKETRPEAGQWLKAAGFVGVAHTSLRLSSLSGSTEAGMVKCLQSLDGLD